MSNAVIFSSSTSFFSASATAASGLIGLLFVAVAVRPQSIFGQGANPVGRAIAVSAFVALANAFFVSLAALLGQVVFAIVVIACAAVALLSLWRLSRSSAKTPTNRWMAGASIVAYIAEGLAGVCVLPSLRPIPRCSSSP